MSNMMLDLEALKNASVEANPYPYFIVPNFIVPTQYPAIQQDFPLIKQAGSFPVSELQYGAGFQQLLNELHSDALRHIIADKLSINLTDKPIIITVRGRTDRHDGKIHTDSKSKIVTLLLYLNADWQASVGRLRLLYDNNKLDNYAAEVPPAAGTLLVFKVTENGWHGHKPIIGERRSLQMNYLCDANALAKHQVRHKFSAKIKKMTRLFGLGSY